MPAMNLLPAVALGVALLGGPPAPVPAPVPAAPAARSAPAVPRDGFERYQNDSETCSLEAPSSAEQLHLENKADRAMTLIWKEPPWMHLRVQVHVYPGQTNLDHLREFLEKMAGGNYGPNTVAYLTEDKARFTITPNSEGNLYMGMLLARVQGKIGYGLWLSVNRKLFADRREDLDHIIDSFRTMEAPEDTYTVPDGWHKEVSDRFVIMGPVDAAAPPAQQEKQRLRIAQVRSWVDNEDGPLGWFRAMFDDKRKFLSRRVIHVHHDHAAFRGALGEHHQPGMKAFYLFDHKDRPVVVNGHPDSAVTAKDVLTECGVQYFESRTGTLPPWQRSGLRGFYRGCVERGFMPCMNYVLLEKAKNDVFKRRPPKYADLQAAGEKELRDLGEAGEVASWAFVYFHMKGPDDALRRQWNDWLADAARAGEAVQTWAATHAKPKEDPRKIDSAVAKWLKEEKLPEK